MRRITGDMCLPRPTEGNPATQQVGTHCGTATRGARIPLAEDLYIHSLGPPLAAEWAAAGSAMQCNAVPMRDPCNAHAGCYLLLEPCWPASP